MIRFFQDFGVRETIESIVVAIMLAFLFKSFEAEAYIIPTGSMAPTLRGEHFDLACEQCGYRYQCGALENANITRTFCPMCRYVHFLRPAENVDDRPFDGDRILVNKFIYDFSEPNRWDVIVFKNPLNAKQNYIKRLCGLPNEGLLIERGDLYTYDTRSQSFGDRQIARKSPRKVRAMMQIVHDSKYVGKKLHEIGWPSRWQEWDASGEPQWKVVTTDGIDQFQFAGDDTQMHWLRYRHLLPAIKDWDDINRGRLPARIQKLEQRRGYGGGAITDLYAYNESNYSYNELTQQGMYEDHWVGDVGLECWVDIQSDSGSIAFETVEGGARFVCTIDVATGTGTLSCTDPNVRFVDGDAQPLEAAPQCQTSIRGSGRYRIALMNADDRLFFWVNDRPVPFGDQSFQDFTRSDPVRLSFSPQDHGDLEPLSIGCQGLKVDVQRIKVWRDVYYIASTATDRHEYRLGLAVQQVEEILADPEAWSDPLAKQLFDSQSRGESDVRKFGPQAYFPMGDNSPSSFDARLWPDPAFVDREQLLGRALFVFFPHSWNRPIPFLPDFTRMRFIR